MRLTVADILRRSISKISIPKKLPEIPMIADELAVLKGIRNAKKLSKDEVIISSKKLKD